MILLFKAFILQPLCNLPDQALGFQTLDRCSFSRFPGLHAIDASIVKVPVQLGSRKENGQIKAGEEPEGWSEAKRR